MLQRSGLTARARMCSAGWPRLATHAVIAQSNEAGAITSGVVGQVDRVDLYRPDLGATGVAQG
jgi:hypothetical protein